MKYIFKENYLLTPYKAFKIELKSFILNKFFYFYYKLFFRKNKSYLNIGSGEKVKEYCINLDFFRQKSDVFLLIQIERFLRNSFYDWRVFLCSNWHIFASFWGAHCFLLLKRISQSNNQEKLNRVQKQFN